MSVRFDSSLPEINETTEDGGKIREKSSERGKHWEVYLELLDDLNGGKTSVTKNQSIDTFEQHHRISKSWPKVKIPGYEVFLSMAFSYPFVEPPEMLPEFDNTLFE